MAFNGDNFFFQWFNSNVTEKLRLMVTTHSSQKLEVCYTEEECTLYCPKTVALRNVTKGPILWEEVWTHTPVFLIGTASFCLYSPKTFSHISLPAGETRNKIFPCRDGERLWSLQLHQNLPLPWSKIQHYLHSGT